MDRPRFVLKHPGARLPKRGSPGAAGYDLISPVRLTIRPGARANVATGVWLASLPKNHYLRVAPRSGLAVKHGIDVGAGVLDNDYRGQISVVLFNHGQEEVTISPGDRVAQAILTPYNSAEPEEVNEDSVASTARGASGFGSTGGLASHE